MDLIIQGKAAIFILKVTFFSLVSQALNCEGGLVANSNKETDHWISESNPKYSEATKQSLGVVWM